MKRLWRVLRWPLYALLLVALVSASPIPWIEARCVTARAPDAPRYTPILAPEHRRPLVNTYLAYPEWSIVHAYEDFAGVLRAGSETDFAYLDAISDYWSNLCAVMRVATREGDIPFDMRAMLHIIGASFTAEMAVKGLYERSIGMLSVALRGAERTPEDAFALALAEDYARFLRQTPWYEYPFGASLARFWSEVPWRDVSWTRSIERRVALTLELGVKTVYAKAMGLLAGVAPADTTLRTVVRGMPAAALAAIGDVKQIERRADGLAVIETPRYRAFTDILRRIAAAGGEVVEIAGNDRVFVTLLSSAPEVPALGAAPVQVEAWMQGRPGWRRLGATLRVADLARVIRATGTPMLEMEHVYDY